MSLPYDGAAIRKIAYSIYCPVSVQQISEKNYEQLCQLDVGEKYKHRVVPVSKMIANAHFRSAYRLLALYDATGPAVGVLSYERVSNDIIQLHTLAIFEQYQCCGYGTYALGFVRRLAGALGAKYVRILVENDQKLMNFYKRRAFVRQDAPFYNSASNYVTMLADVVLSVANDDDSDISSDSDASSLPSTYTDAADDAATADAAASPHAKRPCCEAD